MSWALAFTGLFLVVEAITGFLTHSLALLSDAAHMLTDVTALALSLMAMHLARKPADPKRTFGYRRFEIVAAALNAGALLVIGAFILFEAYRRFEQPPHIKSIPMLVVAVLGLVVNLASMRVLHGGHETSLNVKGAYLEVLSDALGSVAVIIGAAVIHFTGWWPIDPILAVLIGLWVVPRSWKLLGQSVHILLEGTPEGLDLGELQRRLAELPGVSGVHDLHVWSLTSGVHSLSVHLVVRLPDLSLVRQAQQIAREYDIDHCTVQLEDEETLAGERDVHLPVPSRATTPPERS